MNLRVDLIFESEQRSASVFSPKSLMRIAIVVVPAIILLGAGTAVWKMVALRTECRNLEGRLEVTQNLKSDAKELSETLVINENIQKKLNWWIKSEINWSTQMLALQRIVPSTIQITTMQITESFKKGSSRIYLMKLKGKSRGATAADSEADVQRLARQIKSADGFKGMIGKTQVKKFNKDTSARAEKNDRIFLIECTYKPRNP
ncbi:MAG: hypothetical protein KAH23_08500 [Kiritimatiellae bacterium]|nr:hypothetical protein [Kiritimatiellia bacterium]